MTTDKARLVGLSTALAVMLVSSSCDGPALPQNATVAVEAMEPEDLSLIVSTRFRTVDGDLSFTNADTIPITGDYSERFPLNGEARISATLVNNGESDEVVRLVVSVDGRLQFDKTGILLAGQSLPFVYRFLLTGR